MIFSSEYPHKGKQLSWIFLIKKTLKWNGCQNFGTAFKHTNKNQVDFADSVYLIQCVFFYGDKCICWFDPLKIASD